MSNPKVDEKKPSLLKQAALQIVAGGSAGFVEVCLMHPLDLVKTRLQIQNKKSFRNTASSATNEVNKRNTIIYRYMYMYMYIYTNIYIYNMKYNLIPLKRFITKVF